MDQQALKAYRELIDSKLWTHISDDQIARLANEVENLAEAIVDAFDSLDQIDQSLFSPPGDQIDQFNAQLAMRGVPAEDE